MNNIKKEASLKIKKKTTKVFKVIITACLVITFAVSIISCKEKTVIELTGIAYPTSPPSTRVSTEWYVPGEDMSGLSLDTYYVEVDIVNKGRERIDLPGVEAYFYGEDGDILLIRVVQPGDLEPGKKATFHLDTNGYTSWLLMSLNKDTPVTIYISLKSKGEVVSSFTTNLPPYLDFRTCESLPLDFSLTEDIPNIDTLQPVKAEDLGIPGAFGIGPPAVMRIQDDETAVYFYCRNSKAQK